MRKYKIILFFFVFLLFESFFIPAYGKDLGSFHISQEISEQWVELFSEPFNVAYSTKEFTLTPIENNLKVRIEQKNIPFGDIEKVVVSACGVDLIPKYAKYVNSGENILEDILSDDNNVVVNHELPVELFWNIPEQCKEDVILSLTANEYVSLEENAFRFPNGGSNTQTYKFLNNGSLIIDGVIDEVDGIKDPTYKPYWAAGTGHPSNYTYMYLLDDENYVYLALDITLDNTNEYGFDWLKVIAINTINGSEKEYRIDDYSDIYGKCAFGLTSKVSYKHQTCEVKIPKSELIGQNIDFFVRYYGTGGGGGSLQFIDIYRPSSIFDNTPVITGKLISSQMGNIQSVNFGLFNEDTSTFLIDNYIGVCLPEDGLFDSTEEYFTCNIDVPIELHTNYSIYLQGVAQGGELVKSLPIKSFDEDDNYITLHDFCGGDSDGLYPSKSLSIGSNYIYGVSSGGDWLQKGMIYKMNLDGGNFKDLYMFSSSHYSPVEGVILDSENIYGTLQQNWYSGELYTVKNDGTEYSTLLNFEGNNGSTPNASPVLYNNILYGTTSAGGTFGDGIIYSFNLDGNIFNTLHEFAGTNGDGVNPKGQLTYSDGILYGMTYAGGVSNFGTIFSINNDGSNYRILHKFSGGDDDGANPNGGLILSDGVLYGTTSSEGDTGCGEIFSINQDGSDFTLIHKFVDTDGCAPYASLAIDNNILYGTAPYGGVYSQGVLFSINIDGTDFSLLHSFGNNNDGREPLGNLAIFNNSLYGTTIYGGTCSYGTVFVQKIPDEISPTGGITIDLGNLYTISPSVSLTLTAVDNSSGVDQMMICNNLSFTDCTWETYSTTKAWTFDSTLGSKSVYVKFKDKAGNISSVYTDSIILHTPSVRITEIGLVKDLADKSPLTVYFTSVTPLVKGVTQSGSTVYFVYDGKTYSTVADSNGNFSISLTVSQGTNTIQYYSNDISSNQSITKTLNLIVGTQYFPESLLINMGLMTPTQEQEDTPDEDTPEKNTPPVVKDNDPVQEEESNEIQTLKFTDKEGNPLVNAFVTIDGQEYYTDNKGEIQVLGLEKDKKYKVKVEVNGVKYTSEVLGVSGEDGSIKVTITKGDIISPIDWKKILIYSGIGLLFIFFLILIFKRRKEKEDNNSQNIH